MNKKGSKILKVLVLVCIIALCIGLYLNNVSKHKGIRITKWDNVYNENNITLFYEDMTQISEKSVIKQLNEKFKIQDIVKLENGDIEKALKAIDILHNITEYDDVEDSKSFNAIGILQEKGERKKASGRDMAVIERDILLACGLNARVGEFRKLNPQFESKPSYYVVEYWSSKYNKWVMMDIIDKGYLEKDNVPLSAIEAIESNLKDVIYVGTSAQNTYKKNLKKYLGSYTINIDGTVDMKKSNSYITYFEDNEAIDLKLGESFAPPTIYTNERDMFIREPGKQIEGKDSKAYLLLMKKPLEGTEEYNFIIGGFQDGKIMKEYYIRQNSGDMKKVDMYDEMTLDVGENKIELSLDGVNIISSITIVRDK